MSNKQLTRKLQKIKEGKNNLNTDITDVIKTQQPSDIRFSFYEDYKILEPIGGGAQGEVFKVNSNDENLEQTLAAKIHSFVGAIDVKEPIARFEQETKALSKLEHKRIPKVHESGVVSNNHKRKLEYVVVMDFVGDQSLKTIQKQNLTHTQVEKIMDDMLETLAYIHSKGIVHKDIKPNNIRIDSDTLETYLTDFGIAKDVQDLTRMTQWGAGTLNYMSPEQIKGESTDYATDLYSLGVVLNELMSNSDQNSPLQIKINSLMEKNIKKRKKAWNLDLSGEEPKYVLNKNLISHKRKTGSFSIKEWGEIGFVISYVFLTPVVAHLIAPPIIDDTEENVQVIEREEQYKSPKIEEIKGPFEEIEIDIEELTPTTQYEKARYLNDNEPEITRFHTTFNKNGYNFGQKGAFEYLLTDRGQVTSQGYHNIQILDSDKFLGELGSSCKYLMDEKGDIIATSSEHCVDMMYVLNLELDK